MLPPRAPDRRPIVEPKPRPQPDHPATERGDDGRLVLRPRLRIADRERAERVMRIVKARGAPC